MVDVTYIDII